jgi:hypothetical protein
MKVTASVPDDLWATVHGKGQRPSHTVQRGLQLLASELERSKEPFAQAPPDVDRDRLRAGREKLLAEALVRLREGYEWGISLASAMSWDSLDGLLDVTGSQIVSLSQDGKQETVGPHDLEEILFDVAVNSENSYYWQFFEDIGEFWHDDASLATESGHGVLLHNQTFLKGAARALVDTYRAVIADLDSADIVKRENDR